MIEPIGAARRRRPKWPSATQKRNVVGLLYTTKINIIFVGLAAGMEEKQNYH